MESANRLHHITKTYFMQTSRSFFITCLLAVSAFTAGAQTRVGVDINHATVFLNGAELSSTAKVSLPQGETDILFTNIAGNVNQQSLNIGADNGVIIQSASFQNNYLAAETLSPHARVIKDSIQLIQDKRAGTNNMLQVTNEQITLLSENKQVAGANTGLSVAELAKMLDLVKTRMMQLLTEKDMLNATLRKTDEQLKLLQLQLDIEQKKDFQPGGQLLVKFYSTKATSSNINISYVVPNAGWSPSYDLRVEDLKNPVKLFYKANVYQNSGVNWNKIKISLSTGNPNEGAQAPALSPWYLVFNQPAYAGGGYTNKALNENVVMAYKVPLVDKGADDIESMPTRSTSPGTIANYVRTDNSGINTTFDIDLPYTVPTDGQAHLVAVKDYELPATYRYYTVPKMDKDVFLQAQVTNWEDMNLLPAATNIFYEGSYVGQGYIDMRNVKDTMNISLGRDKKIIVRRERDMKQRSVKTIGSNVKETFAYTISIRNTRKEPINILVMDQLPVSNDKDIVVEDIETDKGEVEETTGTVKWLLTINPNEVMKKKIGFTVKYPKGQSINL